MTPESEHGRGRLRLGPGPRQPELAAVLGALGARVEPLGDLADLLLPGAGASHVVLEGEELPEEDVGILRRFAVASEQRSVVVLGGDPRSRALLRVLELPRVRFLAWPPDLDQLRALASAQHVTPTPHTAPTPAAVPGEPDAAPEGPTPPARAAGQEHASRTNGEPAPAPASAPPTADGAALAEELAEAIEEGRAGGATGSAHVTPVLARLEGALERLRTLLGDHADAAGMLDEAAQEMRELEALSEPLAPAGVAGEATFDLGELVEELLAGVAVGGGEAPRFLYRSSGDLAMSAPRERLASGLEALFRTARSCAEAGTVVQVQAEVDPLGSALRLSINFPAGGLELATVRRILEGGDAADSGAAEGLGRAARALLGLEVSLSAHSDAFHRIIVSVVLPRGLSAGRAAPRTAERGRKAPAPELDPFA